MADHYSVASGKRGEVFSSNAVLRNTYALLGLSLVPTVFGALLGINMQFSFAQQHPIMFMIGSLVLIYGLFAAVSANRNSSMGVFLLLALTFVLGLMLGPILQHALSLANGGKIVGLAAGGTAVAFLTLAGIATITKRDFSFMGKFLLVGIVLLILASIANLFLQLPALQLTLSAVGVLLFSGFILFDVSRIVNGGETNYVMATLSLYINIYNLFTSLLQLLIGLMGGRE